MNAKGAAHATKRLNESAAPHSVLRSSLMRAWIALLCVYFFWGTTYLGIRVALETTPPLLLVAMRFTISGVLMLAVAKWQRQHIPSIREREFWWTSLFGLGMLGIGNTCLAVAEQWIPAGLAAVFVTTSPFWMVGLDAIVPGGDRFQPRVLWGMMIGLAGVILLLLPGLGDNGQTDTTSSTVIAAFLVLQIGNIGWSTGSIFQRRYPAQAHPIVSGALQQLVTGLLFWIPALLTQKTPYVFTWRGSLAILYLATFGSIIGYSAYLYVLDKLPIPIVSTYVYVNPIVACVLGWLILSEPFGLREIAAMMIIFSGVAVVRRMQRSPKTT
jgi:drug/metabolite transporter (DMT)-like permease